jgi:hypothetical protein
MVVFSHKTLPLTSSLKESEDCESVHDASAEFKQICRVLVDAVRGGLPAKEVISFDYNYRSLWSPRLKDRKGHKVNIWKCSKETFTGLLRSDTYWYKRLPKSSRNRVKKLAGDSKGRRKIKDVLDTCDGVIGTLLFSFPELFLHEGYALSDRIFNSVINSCFHNYDRFQKKLKLLRKTVKFHALAKTEITLNYDELRDMSWMVRPLQIFNKICKRSSKEKMFRVAMFCQTRATGLAGQKQIEESIDDFLSSVMQEKQFKPDALLTRCIEAVTDKLANELYVGRNAEFKVSMSTSACTESPRRTEGKFGFLKSLVRDYELKIPPLSEGKPGTIGNIVWREAVERLRTEHDKVMKVNVAAVRENGKARIVTSGSFWKDGALQPFSHITIHLAKIFANLKNGLQAGRLGWRYIQKFKKTVGDRDGFNWIFDSTPKYHYSTDWKKATDGPSTESGWAVTGTLLRKCGLDQESLDVVKEYWLGPKRLHYKGKFIGLMRSGIPMGDPLTKTNLSLAHPICDLYARLSTGALSAEEGNGDDTIAPCDDPDYAKEHLRAANMLGYETSELDEALTPDWGTYCEEWFHLPVSEVNTTDMGTRLKNSLLLPYLDVPKVRTMIATTKDRIDFSADPRGKVTLLGHDQEYFTKDDLGPQNTIYAIASAFQDVTLATIDDKVPLFLPRQVNGVGKPPPYWSSQSWMNIINNCRTWHAKYYYHVMKEINAGVVDISGYRGALKEQNHFEKEMMVELFEIPLHDPIRRYIVVKSDHWSDYPEGVLLKLITLGYLVPESKIAKYYLFQERLEQLEQDTKRDLFEVVKARMIKTELPPSDVIQKTVERFCNDYMDSPYRLYTAKTENLYVSQALEKLQAGDPLQVSDHPFPLKDKFKKRVRPSSSYEENGLLLYEWFMGAFQSLRRGEKYDLPPTDILADDPIILLEIERGGADIFIIATDDLKLVRLAQNKFPDTWIFRISCIHYLQTNTYCSEMELDYDEEFTDRFTKTYKTFRSVKVLVDKGSVETFTHQYHTDDKGTYWKTIGIPWRKDIKKENMERKPHHGSIHAPKSMDFAMLQIPRSLYDQRVHNILLNRR